MQKINPHSEGDIGAPMAGRVVRVNVQRGEMIEAGQTVVMVSAMKMVSAGVDMPPCLFPIPTLINIETGDQCQFSRQWACRDHCCRQRHLGRAR